MQQRSWASEQLYNRLRAAQVNSTVRYKDLSELISRDVQRGARHVLTRALRRLEREDGMLFQCVLKEGIRRVTSGDAVITEQPLLRTKIRRVVRRAKSRLAAADRDYESYSPEARAASAYQHTFQAIIDLASARRIANSINKAIEQNPQDPQVVLRGTLKLWPTARKLPAKPKTLM
jgi:hypothetical protein